MSSNSKIVVIPATSRKHIFDRFYPLVNDDMRTTISNIHSNEFTNEDIKTVGYVLTTYNPDWDVSQNNPASTHALTTAVYRAVLPSDEIKLDEYRVAPLVAFVMSRDVTSVSFYDPPPPPRPIQLHTPAVVLNTSLSTTSQPITTLIARRKPKVSEPEDTTAPLARRNAWIDLNSSSSSSSSSSSHNNNMLFTPTQRSILNATRPSSVEAVYALRKRTKGGFDVEDVITVAGILFYTKDLIRLNDSVSAVDKAFKQELRVLTYNKTLARLIIAFIRTNRIFKTTEDADDAEDEYPLTTITALQQADKFNTVLEIISRENNTSNIYNAAYEVGIPVPSLEASYAWIKMEVDAKRLVVKTQPKKKEENISNYNAYRQMRTRIQRDIKNNTPLNKSEIIAKARTALPTQFITDAVIESAYNRLAGVKQSSSSSSKPPKAVPKPPKPLVPVSIVSKPTEEIDPFDVTEYRIVRFNNKHEADEIYAYSVSTHTGLINEYNLVNKIGLTDKLGAYGEELDNIQIFALVSFKDMLSVIAVSDTRIVGWRTAAKARKLASDSGIQFGRSLLRWLLYTFNNKSYLLSDKWIELDANRASFGEAARGPGFEWELDHEGVKQQRPKTFYASIGARPTGIPHEYRIDAASFDASGTNKSKLLDLYRRVEVVEASGNDKDDRAISEYLLAEYLDEEHSSADESEDEQQELRKRGRLDEHGYEIEVEDDDNADEEVGDSRANAFNLVDDDIDEAPQEQAVEATRKRLEREYEARRLARLNNSKDVTDDDEEMAQGLGKMRVTKRMPRRNAYPYQHQQQ